MGHHNSYTSIMDDCPTFFHTKSATHHVHSVLVATPDDLYARTTIVPPRSTPLRRKRLLGISAPDISATH